MITGVQKTFIEQVAKIAIEQAPKYDIKVVSPIIAQAIIESNWGTSGLAIKGKNLFGIKCGSSWKGKAINMNTKEEYAPGTLTNVNAAFRAYDSWEESILDYFKFTSTKRYAALKLANTPQEYCESIKAAGYATSSTYVDTLMNCIETYNLADYDEYVGAFIETIPNAEPEPIEATITAVIDYSHVVDQVMRGLYGNGDDRITRLAKNGYNPLAIQYMVNLQTKIDNLTEECNKCYDKINKAKEVLA